MATRSTIKIQGIEFAKIYKHWDGYPEGMKEQLESFNKDFNDNRGYDPSYKFAQLLRASKELWDDADEKYTGWGIVQYDIDSGEEYEYMLMNDGSVDVKVIYP